jgi:PadR family transcriptional regulator PadR
MAKRVELPPGTLELLISKSISLGPLHGYGILLRIQQISGERLELLQGSFYTAVYRLERNGGLRGNGVNPKTIAGRGSIVLQPRVGAS